MKRTGYPIGVRLDGKRRFIISIESPSRDRLLQKRGSIVVGKTIADLRKQLRGARHPRVVWDYKYRVDLDDFFRKVSALRPNRASTTKTNKVLLNGWNLLEDVAFTIEAPKTLKIYSRRVLPKVYQKVFWGNNLPAVTPEGRTYWPVWTDKELGAFRPALRELVKHLVDNAPEVMRPANYPPVRTAAGSRLRTGAAAAQRGR